MTDMDLVREDAVKTVLAHYKVAGIGSMVMDAGRGLLNAGRAGATAYKEFAPLTNGVGPLAQTAGNAARAGWNAFRGAGGLRHASTIGMGAGALYGGSRLIGSGLSAGMGNQQQQPRPIM
jgi:hypothetical protein